MQDKIPESERYFAWRNIQAYLDGELNADDAARVDALLSRCERTQNLARTQHEFAEAVRRCMNETPAECPQDLRDKVLAALDQCEADGELDDEVRARRLVGFPWVGASMLAAACLMFAFGVFQVFGSEASELEPGLPARLIPVVSSVQLDGPKSERCRYRSATAEYRKHFPDGPDLPHQFGNSRCRVVDYHCGQVDGRPVMCATYDSPEGDRFAVLVFKRECLGRAAPEAVRAAEVEIGGKLVLMWHDCEKAKYMHALVAGAGNQHLYRRMDELRLGVASR